MTLLSLETPGPYPIQEGIYTSFYISVSEPLMYTGFPLYEAKFYFLLLTSLGSTFLTLFLGSFVIPRLLDGSSLMAQMVRNLPGRQKTHVQSLG